jgi:hypothetical protein
VKFKSAFDLTDSIAKKYFDELVVLRRLASSEISLRIGRSERKVRRSVFIQERELFLSSLIQASKPSILSNPRAGI